MTTRSRLHILTTRSRWSLLGTLLAPDLTRMSRMTGSFLTTGKVKLARTDAMESMMTNPLSHIIRKSCDLKVSHTLHIWEVPFLDGHVRYFCQGILPEDLPFLDLLTSFYGEVYNND